MRHSCFPRTRSIRLITTRHARSFSRQVGNKVASADIPESDYANWKPPRFLSLPDLPPLPPAREWKAAFPSVKAAHARAYVSDFDTALAIADAFVPEGSLNKTVVEAYPGASSHWHTFLFAFLTHTRDRRWNAYSGTIEPAKRTYCESNRLGGRFHQLFACHRGEPDALFSAACSHTALSHLSMPTRDWSS